MLAILGLTGCAAPRALEPPEALDVQGHRGFRGRLPENTLAGFEAAVVRGVTTLELDLQVTRDRVLVVHHDQRLDARRCRSSVGASLPDVPIKDLAWDALDGIDCGSLPHPDFPDQRPVAGARIPRIEQVFEIVKESSYPVGLNLEIKMQRREDGIPLEEFAALLVNALDRHGLGDRAIVQSYKPAALRAVARLDPGLKLAILAEKRRDYDRLLLESGASVLSPEFRRLRRRDVERFRARGVQVIPWTVNRPEDIRRLLAWGVEGIISDYPDRVLETLGRPSLPAGR